MKAPRLVWELAGCPTVEGGSAKLFTDTESLCAMCGQVQDRTAPADKVLGQNFTDRGLFMAPHAPRVCWGCVSICSGSPPRTWRQWTVVATPSRHLPPSQEKAEDGGFTLAECEHGKRHISGVRAEESRVRRIAMARWGTIGPYAARPIGNWSAVDIFAYLHKYDLPIHPAYAMSMAGHYDRRWLRVSSLGGIRGAERSRADWEAAYYPEIVSLSR